MASAQRGVLCRRQSAPSPRAPAHAGMTERANVCLQGLELLVTVLLARNRPPPPTVAAGVPHATFAAELISLPSGLLAMVCEAIVKLTVRLGGAACVHCCVGIPLERGRRGRGARCQRSPLGAVRPYAEYSPYYLQSPHTLAVNCSSGFRCGPVSDVERACAPRMT